jgi:hypothetical protein
MVATDTRLASLLLVALSQRGVTVRVQGDMLIATPIERIPDGIKPILKHQKRQIMALLCHLQEMSERTPPPDAELLLEQWRGRGRPEIPLSPGVSISNLETWLCSEVHTDDELAIVRGFLKGA